MSSNITTPQSKPGVLAITPTDNPLEFATPSSPKRLNNLSDNNTNTNTNINISEPPSKTSGSFLRSVNSPTERNSPSSMPSSTSSKFGSFLKNLGWLKWGSVIIILAFLGFNIFNALGDATTGVTNIFRPIASLFGYTVGETTKQTVKMSAKGTKEVVDIAADTVDSGVNALEKGLTGKNQRNAVDKNRATTMKALDNAKKRPRSPPTPPEADDAGSRTQQSRASGKTGFCYIGEDRGFRSCIKVNEDDKCMSGQIFPTKEVCINPNLRS